MAVLSRRCWRQLRRHVRGLGLGLAAALALVVWDSPMAADSAAAPAVPAEGSRFTCPDSEHAGADAFPQNADTLLSFIQANLGAAGTPASFTRPIIRGGLVEQLRITTAVMADKMSYFVARRDGQPFNSDGAAVRAEVYSRAADTDKPGNILLDLLVPEPLERSLWGLVWQPVTYYVVGCPQKGGALIQDGKPAGLVAVATAPVSSRISAAVFGVVIVGLLYALAAWAMAPSDEPMAPGAQPTLAAPTRRWWQKRPSPGMFNPLRFTAGLTGRTSLSNLQLLYITLIIVWLVCYALLRTGSWAEIDTNLMSVFGIVAAGTVWSRYLRAGEQLSVPNLEWLKRWRWLEFASPIKGLFKSRGEPDVARFQAVAFGLVIGIAMVLAAFNDRTLIGNAAVLLGLLGASQLTYVMGQKVASLVSDGATVKDLNDKLDDARGAERNLVALVADLPTRMAVQAQLEATRAEAEESNSDLLKKLGELEPLTGGEQALAATLAKDRVAREELAKAYGSPTWPDEVPGSMTMVAAADKELEPELERVSAAPAQGHPVAPVTPPVAQPDPATPVTPPVAQPDPAAPVAPPAAQPDPVAEPATAAIVALKKAQTAATDLLEGWRGTLTLEDAKGRLAELKEPTALAAAVQAYRSSLTTAADVLEAQLDVPRPRGALYGLTLNER
jgi:hypothetical protein